ncbi:MAG: major facilitator superfamily transporter [Frankiales bacterium]|nr:major facilitator superfamily transporter [Frankiales bacterium]
MTQASTPAALERRGLLLGFAAFGGFWGAWSAVLPDVRTQTGLPDGQLGLALAAIAVAALPAMPVAGRLVDRHGARRLIPVSMGSFAAVAVLPGFAEGLVPLVLALLLLGATTGALDVLLNTATASWERREGTRLMAGAHGCFSVGVLVASVATGVARDLGAGPRTVLGASAALLALATLVQPPYRGVVREEPVGNGRRRIAPLLLALGLLTAASFLIEDAVQAWSALHLERTHDAPPWVGGLGPGVFAGAMAAARFGAQALGRSVSDARLVGGGGGVLAVGLLLLALGPGPAVVLVGALVAGAGVGVLAPTLFSAVGSRSLPGQEGADLALVSATGYLGFVLGPPLVGLLSALTSLPTALALLAALATVVAVAGPSALAGTRRSHPQRAGRLPA